MGSKKMLVFDDMQAAEKIKIYDKGADRSDDGPFDSYGDYITLRNGDIHIPSVKMTEPLRMECQHFLDCIRNHHRPLSDGLEGLQVL